MSSPNHSHNRSWGYDGDSRETNDRKTISYDPTVMIELDLGPHNKPENPWQALMETEPHNDPAEDQQTYDKRMQPLRDALEDPNLLTERERWILEARFYWRLSIRDLATKLPWSQTHIHRIEHQARKKLADHLKETYG